MKAVNRFKEATNQNSAVAPKEETTAKKLTITKVQDIKLTCRTRMAEIPDIGIGPVMTVF